MHDDFGFLAGALASADAAAFVHVGRDADLRYLAGVAPASDWGVVYADGRATLLVPPRDRPRVDEAFSGAVRTFDDAETAAGAAVAETLGDCAPGTVLAPRQIPHDAALYVERAGHDLASTAAVAEARSVKSPAERDRLRAVAGAAERGLDRAAAVLGAADAADDALRWQGAPLTGERLRRQVNAALAAGGASDAGATVVDAGDCGRRDPDRRLRSGVPVVVTVAPRGRRGYRAPLARTFVVDGEGGWERRAQVALEAARDAAVSTVEAGAPVADVDREATAELAAHGFDPDGADVRVHGVGLERVERPTPRGGTTLGVGTALAVAVRVSHADETVGVADTLVLTADGPVVLTDRPRSLSPPS